MRRTWGNLGGQLGLGCIAIGILIIGLAWNGAAGVDFVQGQVPYLLSGGFLGLALVVFGAALVVVQSNRRDRSVLEAQLRELNTAIVSSDRLAVPMWLDAPTVSTHGALPGAVTPP